MREVPALVEAEAHDGVAGRQQRGVRLHVGAGARVGLDVGVFDAEQLLGAVDGKLLGDVDELAAAVVAAAGVALGVLVGERRALRFEDTAAGVVLRRNQDDVAPLSVGLLLDGSRNLGVSFGQNAHVAPPTGP